MPYETRFIIFFLKYDFLNELNVKLNIIHFLGENKKQEIYFQSSRINVLKLKVSIYVPAHTHHYSHRARGVEMSINVFYLLEFLDSSVVTDLLSSPLSSAVQSKQE